MSEVGLRFAGPADASALAAIHLASWRHAYAGIVPDGFLDGVTPEDRLQRWRRALDPAVSVSRTLVATRDGTAVAFCEFGPDRDGDPSHGEVRALHVQPGSTRRGLGAMLLREAETSLAAAGHSAGMLWVLAGNVNAERFYQAQGWHSTPEQRTHELRGYSVAEVRYTKLLAPG